MSASIVGVNVVTISTWQAQEILSRFFASGLSITEFCQQESVNRSRLYRYIDRFASSTFLESIDYYEKKIRLLEGIINAIDAGEEPEESPLPMPPQMLVNIKTIREQLKRKY